MSVAASAIAAAVVVIAVCKKCASMLVLQLAFVIRRDCKASQIRIITPDFDLFVENVQKKNILATKTATQMSLCYVLSYGCTWLSLVAEKSGNFKLEKI